jgi:DNA-binding Xre family transcriptional regulator
MDKTPTILHQLMHNAKITTYLQLSRQSNVPELHFYRIENGLLDKIPLGILKKIATTLEISLASLIDYLDFENTDKNFPQKNYNLSLDNQLLITEYQQETILILESLFLQLPTFIHGVNHNPDLPASRLLPLLQPLEELLWRWEIYPIGKVGDIVDYNPEEHDLMEDSDLNPDNIPQVKIRYVGYRQREKLLYRAKVSVNN